MSAPQPTCYRWMLCHYERFTQDELFKAFQTESAMIHARCALLTQAEAASSYSRMVVWGSFGLAQQKGIVLQ